MMSMTLSGKLKSLITVGANQTSFANTDDGVIANWAECAATVLTEAARAAEALPVDWDTVLAGAAPFVDSDASAEWNAPSVAAPTEAACAATVDSDASAEWDAPTVAASSVCNAATGAASSGCNAATGAAPSGCNASTESSGVVLTEAAPAGCNASAEWDVPSVESSDSIPASSDASFELALAPLPHPKTLDMKFMLFFSCDFINTHPST